MNDKVLMRIKDVILIVGCLTGVVAWGLKLYSLPDRVEKLETMKAVVEQHTLALALSTNQFSEVIRRLERIEKKMDK